MATDDLRMRRVRAHYANRVDVLTGLISENLHLREDEGEVDPRFRTLIFNTDKQYRATQSPCDCWTRVEGGSRGYTRCLATAFTHTEWQNLSDDDWHSLNGTRHTAGGRTCKGQNPPTAQCDFINFHQSFDRALAIVLQSSPNG